jgi:hypothetical protein
MRHCLGGVSALHGTCGKASPQVSYALDRGTHHSGNLLAQRCHFYSFCVDTRAVELLRNYFLCRFRHLHHVELIVFSTMQVSNCVVLLQALNHVAKGHRCRPDKARTQKTGIRIIVRYPPY